MEDIQPKRFARWPIHLTIISGLIIGVLYSFGSLARVTGKHKPQKVGPYEIELSVRSEESEGKPARILLTVTSADKPSRATLWYYSLNAAEAGPTLIHKLPPPQKEFSRTEMLPVGQSGLYTTRLPPLKMTEQYYYYLTLSNGSSFNFPVSAPNHPLPSITYRRSGIFLVTLIHICLMYLVIFFLVHGIYYALRHLASGGVFPIKKTIVNNIWATIFFFTTSFPIGCWMAYNALGLPWTGIPIVWDPNDVDNKSLGIFIYWLVILILIKKNIIRPKVFACLSLLGALLTIILFLSGGHN